MSRAIPFFELRDFQIGSSFSGEEAKLAVALLEQQNWEVTRRTVNGDGSVTLNARRPTGILGA